MRLRNKKTGEIVELFGISRKGDRTFIQFEDERGVFKGEYSSLAELNAEWDDYEEPKEYWYIDYEGGILIGETDNSLAEKMMISIGNHFKTLSEAEKAVEKLKAWKRLKDKNFHFLKYSALGCGEIEFSLDFEDMDDEGEIGELQKDLDLLFGGEE